VAQTSSKLQHNRHSNEVLRQWRQDSLAPQNIHMILHPYLHVTPHKCIYLHAHMQ
jgi:hypothetical protein